MKTILCLGLLYLTVAFAQEKDQPEPKKAQDLLKEALAKAKEGKKRVLLTFGSPG